MGRKPLTKQYFGPEQELAVRIFLTATTWEEKNTVYNTFLRDPLTKMIDSIIRRYRLYRPNMEFNDIHVDTLSFLVTKMEDDELPLEKIISSLVVEIKQFINENRLNINEEKIGYCLIDVFENYKTIFIAGKGNKFNKNVILYQLREMSGLTTKEIRASLKPYKNIYRDILGSLVNQ
jgi:hypothetical protein